MKLTLCRAGCYFHISSSRAYTPLTLFIVEMGLQFRLSIRPYVLTRFLCVLLEINRLRLGVPIVT